jgi:hypothetical protein
MRHPVRRRLGTAALALAALSGLLVLGMQQPGEATGDPAKVVARPVGDIPAALARRGVRVGGTPVRAVVFNDANGRNLVVLSRRDQPGRPDPSTTPAIPTRTALLYADHFVTSHGVTRRLRAVRDSDRDCGADQTADFRPGTPRVADTDGDGIGEVLFAYTLSCSNDVIPLTFKLLVLEDGRKYIVRGQTWPDRLSTAGHLAPGRPEPAWSKWPAPFAARAKFAYRRWTILG